MNISHHGNENTFFVHHGNENEIFFCIMVMRIIFFL